MLSSEVNEKIAAIDYTTICDEKSKELEIAIKEKYAAMDVVKKLQLKIKENERKIMNEQNEAHLNKLIDIFEKKIKKESNEQKKLRKQLHKINEQLSIIRTQKDELYQNDMANFEQSLKRKQNIHCNGDNDDDDDMMINMDTLSHLANIQQMRDCIDLMKEWYLEQMNHLNAISDNQNITKSKIKAMTIKLRQNRSLKSQR